MRGVVRQHFRLPQGAEALALFGDPAGCRSQGRQRDRPVVPGHMVTRGKALPRHMDLFRIPDGFGKNGGSMDRGRSHYYPLGCIVSLDWLL
jgi:hypothetical protein